MKKFFTLIAVAVMAFAAQANELTVAVGTSYSNVNPICGLYADTEGTMTQSIYSADMLAEMAGNQITAVKFYTLAYYYDMYGMVDDDETDYIYFEDAKFQLSLLEVDENGYTDVVAVTGATPVATTVPEYGAMEVEFILDEPFEFTGKNLLVEVSCIEAGEWGQTYFFGAAMDDYCSYFFIPGADENGEDAQNITKHLPMATFTYEAGEEPVDPEDPHATGYWLVQINADGELLYTELFPGQNGDYVNVDDVTYPEFYEICGFYFLIDGVAYGAPEDMTLANLGDADQNPLVPGENTYYVGVGYSYTFGVHFIYDQDTMEFMGYSAYVAKGGRVDVDEVAASKTVAGVRYFNVAGQEMQEANGMTIVVTTYTDGTTSAVKVIK